MTNKNWMVQDVFSSGIPGPSFTFHETEEEAAQEASRRGGAAIPVKICEDCGSLLGLEGRPLRRSCVYCR